MTSTESAQKLNVVICIRHLQSIATVGGAEIQSLRLASSLRQQGHEVTVLAGRYGTPGVSYEQISYNGQTITVCWITVLPLRWLGSLLYVLYAAQYFLFQSSRPQIVHIISIKPNSIFLALLARLRGKRVVYRITGELYVGEVPFFNQTGRFYYRLLKRAYLALLQTGQVFIVQNTALLGEFMALGIDPASVVHIPNGVDSQQFDRPTAQEKAQFRSALGLPQTGFVICCTSRLNSIKRVDVAIQAIHKIHARAQVILLLVGDGAEKTALQDLTQSLNLSNQVRFIGAVKDVRPYLKASDVFVLPSEYEVHSNGLIEALACGLPVIATEVGGNRDTIEHKVNGLLIPPDNPEVLAEALSQIQGDKQLATRLGQQARQSVLEKYTFEAMVQRYTDVYTANIKKQ